MMFHVGSLWRMNELGLLHDVQLVSSVSGGSFVAAQLALAWEKFSVRLPMYCRVYAG